MIRVPLCRSANDGGTIQSDQREDVVPWCVVAQWSLPSPYKCKVSGVIDHACRMVGPPSTIRVWPVMRAARSDDKKMAAFAISIARGGASPDCARRSPNNALGLVVVAAPDVAGGHDVDPNAVATQFVGERLG